MAHCGEHLLAARQFAKAGGVVNVVTKSGTNEFHGDAFGYLWNAVFNARYSIDDKRLIGLGKISYRTAVQ